MKTLAISRAIVVVIVMIAGVRALWACVYSFMPVDVPPTFSVVVKDRGKFLSGMKVILEPVNAEGMSIVTSDAETKISSTSDANGYARFDHIAEGFYRVESALPNGEFKDIHVAPAMVDPKYVISMDWPSLKILESASASGTLRTFCSSSGDCPLSTNVTLVEARTSRELGKQQVQGKFDFGDVPDGLYFLQIRPAVSNPYSSEPEGDVAVEINQQAASKRLVLDIGMSDCGLYYAGDCTIEHLSVNGLCGSIRYVMDDAPIQSFVRLTNKNSGEIISSDETDRSGWFYSNKNLPTGDYLVEVFSLSFTPLRLNAHLNTSNQCQVPIHIRLGAMGECGTAELSHLRSHAQTN